MWLRAVRSYIVYVKSVLEFFVKILFPKFYNCFEEKKNKHIIKKFINLKLLKKKKWNVFKCSYFHFNYGDPKREYNNCFSFLFVWNLSGFFTDSDLYLKKPFDFQTEFINSGNHRQIGELFKYNSASSKSF